MASAPGKNAPNQGENIPLGIGLMVLGMFLFSINDALGKWLAATYAVTQILLLRERRRRSVVIVAGARPARLRRTRADAATGPAGAARLLRDRRDARASTSP